MLDRLHRLGLAALATALAAAATPAAADLGDVLEAGTIRVGIPESFPPFGALGPEGEYVGYDVDVAGMIAEQMGVELELVPLTSSQRIPYLETERVDLVISSMGANAERAKSIWFSNAYAPFFSGAFAAPDVEVAAIDDLAGLSVGLTGGTLEDLALTEEAPDGTDLVRFGDNAATLSAYTSGQVDVLVTGNTVAAQLAENNPDLAVETKFILQNSPCYIGVRRGDMDLLRWVNVFILNAKLDGSLNELSLAWFGQELPELPVH